MSDVRKVSRRIFEEVWNDRNIAAIDELMAADYVHHDPQSPKFPNGREGYKQLVAYYLNAFPDSHFTIDQEIQEGDTVVTRWTVNGTHRGDLPTLPASGKTFSVTGSDSGRKTLQRTDQEIRCGYSMRVFSGKLPRWDRQPHVRENLCRAFSRSFSVNANDPDSSHRLGLSSQWKPDAAER
jgi:steroid delta-isomerase-like uncharacterized protein